MEETKWVTVNSETKGPWLPMCLWGPVSRGRATVSSWHPGEGVSWERQGCCPLAPSSPHKTPTGKLQGRQRKADKLTQSAWD